MADLFESDFKGSFADENVSFATQVVRVSSPGDQYMKTMIFIENDRFIADGASAEFLSVPGVTSPDIKALTVTADSYASKTTGLLQSWLYDLFINANVYDCILVTFGTLSREAGSDPDTEPAVTGTATVDTLAEAYEAMKYYAYHKTILAGSDTGVSAEFGLKLAQLCVVDEDFISSRPYFPLITSSPASDALYAAISADSKADAMFVYHADVTRNGALYLLGLALAGETNASGTPIGNGLEMQKSSNITASGAGGLNPTDAVKAALNQANVGYFKTVGDDSQNAACEYAYTIKDFCIPAYWARAYITYMTKVGIAQMITVRNFKKNADNYQRIVQKMADNILKFSPTILQDVLITAPAFAQIPASKQSQIIITNAWSATYEGPVKSVKISGTLYISA